MRKLLWSLLICLCLAASPVFGAAITDKSIGGLIDLFQDGATTEILVGAGAATIPVWGDDLPTAVKIGSAYIYRVGGTDVNDANVEDDITLTSTKKISTLLTSEQLRLSYDAGNYLTVTLLDDGHTTFVTVDPDGAEADINFNPDGNVGIKTAAPSVALEVTGDIKASGTISANLFTPDAADGADIGTVDLEFSDAYFANAAVLYFQADQSVTMTSGASGLTFNMFPITPSAAPDADYEVANKKYVDENAGVGGNVATDPIWDAAGDLAQGTGANTAAKLSLGTALALLKVNAAGNSVEWGTAGQIAFPSTAVPSGDPNTLDDYEEGTWTPDLQFGGAKVGITYAVTAGSYVKIGGWVFCSAILVLSSKGESTGDATIEGLPFTVENQDASMPGVLFGYFTALSFADRLSGRVNKNTNTILLTEVTNAGTGAEITDADFEDNTNMGGISLFYKD